jgi:hypothetical protein
VFSSDDCRLTQAMWDSVVAWKVAEFGSKQAMQRRAARVSAPSAKGEGGLNHGPSGAGDGSWVETGPAEAKGEGGLNHGPSDAGDGSWVETGPAEAKGAGVVTGAAPPTVPILVTPPVLPSATAPSPSSAMAVAAATDMSGEFTMPNPMLAHRLKGRAALKS